GTGQGIRLETGAGGTLHLLSSAPTPVQTEAKLATDRPTHVVAAFNPREKTVALYLDGKPAARLPEDPKLRIAIIGSQTPLRIGSDQAGEHRFIGSISYLAVYNRALMAEEVAPLFAQPTKSSSQVGLSSQVGAWQLTPGAGRKIEAVSGQGALVMVPDVHGAARGPGGALTLWYARPAREWLESLAFGNGRMGGTVFGGVEQERIQLNEDTIWSGYPYDPANPGAPEAIKKAQELIFAGQQKEAEALIESSAMGLPKTMAEYQTLGSLMLDFPNEASPVTDYHRSLDLNTAIATTTFKRNGVTFTREVFASAPDQVVVVRLTADKLGSLNFNAHMSTPLWDAKAGVENNLLTLSGTGGKFNGKPGQIQFKSFTKVQNEGGTATPQGDSMRVANANAVTMLVSCGTNYVNYQDLSTDPNARALRDLDAAAGKGYAQLRTRHLQDYQQLFNRVSLEVGTGPHADAPTDERLKKFDGKDISLPALYFQFGRYLLISSSRPGTQPANLQGLWNDARSAAWGGKYTINVNTEMNYWPAETTNLSECAEPLFQMVREISQTGQRTAAVMYKADGWVTHHNTDLWRATAPIDAAVGFWPTGGAWLTTHLWEHYLFTGDRKFLESVYPIFKGASQFFMDILVEEPTHKWLVTCPSMSPEHGGLVAGPTMDMSILRDLFAQTAKASEILGVDADFRKTVLATRARLAPFQVGKFGQLQEWLEDVDTQKDTHRHLSHLYGLFPSAQITRDGDAKIFEAARKSLVMRGTIGPGWSLAWKENLWARVGDGDKAYSLLITQLTPPKGGSQGGGTFPNLFDA
ncbi:MAG: glycoside hydrolase N-terminal domain-containing protein, partial [Armatimonadota bacterium]|nr:glycoside hydrolase N-terminal domain-containing protein [Armatimonadota bacterium]